MNNSEATLGFYGGAGSVTGANFLLDSPDGKILIDCGLAQGGVDAEAHNRAPFAYVPHTIDVLIITHAHLDHIGRVPKLVHDGFSGSIYSTPVTKELAALMFEDALGIMEEDARKRGVAPLYSHADVAATLRMWQTREYHQSFNVGRDNIGIRFLDAGHVLGSSMVECTHHGRTIVFTGDVGNSPAPLLKDTEQLPTAHYILMESVYGNRLHEGNEERFKTLGAAVRQAKRVGGTLLIPTFALQRTQVLLYELHRLFEKEEAPRMPVFLDSPLATRVTDVYEQHLDLLNEQAQATLGTLGFHFPELTIASTPEMSRRIAESPDPKIILAGSGMSHGGRIQAHEARFLKDKKTTILFVGYQAAGTPGRRILEGEKKVKVDDTWVRVRASVMQVDGYSAHADRDGLMRVIESAASAPEKVFVVMGEPKSSLFLAQRLHDFLGVDAFVPSAGDVVTIEW